MAKYPFSTWIYAPITEFTPDEVDLWDEAGLNLVMTPMIEYGKVDPALLIPFLDRAEEKGMKLLAFVNGLENDCIRALGEEKYAERFLEVYNKIKHPALYGFFIGDEPGTPELIEDSFACIKLQKKLAPELKPFLNLNAPLGDEPRELLGGKNFKEWIAQLKEETGIENFCYDFYDQVWNDAGIDQYYKDLNYLSEVTRDTGVEFMATVLSSTHYMFRRFNEYELQWQMNVAIACGARGVMWFRFYDRLQAPNYHASPIDEFGQKTERFYGMLRSHRRFNAHYGELMMTLRHKHTYITHKPMGGIDLFGKGSHPVIDSVRGTEPSLISFFEAEDGTEYLCIVNASQTTPGVFRIYFDREKYSLDEVSFNGKSYSAYGHKNNEEIFWDGHWIYPGQLNLFKITAK